ncbi:hypothetical protein [Streptomyces sp. NBC_00038]|uniref:hypothetical protein n=1 Tax=Streptomyces sp. NBC_00038 TaxID=2903615 RepID=UPI002256D863|nr:hypothetical protein [Streptomyces sp. NBC_00038]MCX5554949.1 hypothetical protein [Streptomyces sp. NBC_00038]
MSDGEGTDFALFTEVIEVAERVDLALIDAFGVPRTVTLTELEAFEEHGQAPRVPELSRGTGAPRARP